MLEFLDAAAGVRLTQAEYRPDYRRRFAATVGRDSWKLERQQTFQEPGSASWEAFARGDWASSLRLIEDVRRPMEELVRQSACQRVGLYRVRVVEWPLSPYLQWELNHLAVCAQTGERIRVLPAERVRRFERGGQLPELLTIGTTVYGPFPT